MFPKLRATWVEMLAGNHANSTRRQIIASCRDAAFMGTIQRLGSLDENELPVNSQLMEMLFLGYAFRQALAIRRLVDRGSDVFSLRRVVESMKKNRHALTRQNIVGHDGCPWNAGAASSAWTASIDPEDVARGETHLGDQGLTRSFIDSDLRNGAFDRISELGTVGRDNPQDKVSEYVLDRLLKEMDDQRVKRVTGFVNKFVAHADAKADLADPALSPTNSDVKQALRSLTQIQTFLTAHVLFESSGSVVPVPQFDHLEHLEKPVIPPTKIGLARDVWREESKLIDDWARDDLAMDMFFHRSFLGTMPK